MFVVKKCLLRLFKKGAEDNVRKKICSDSQLTVSLGTVRKRKLKTSFVSSSFSVLFLGPQASKKMHTYLERDPSSELTGSANSPGREKGNRCMQTVDDKKSFLHRGNFRQKIKFTRSCVRMK